MLSTNTNTLNWILMCSHSSMSFCHPNDRNLSLNNISPWGLVTGHVTRLPPSVLRADLLPSSLTLFTRSLHAISLQTMTTYLHLWSHISFINKGSPFQIGTLVKSEEREEVYEIRIYNYCIYPKEKWYHTPSSLACTCSSNIAVPSNNLFPLSLSFPFLLHCFQSGRKKVVCFQEFTHFFKIVQLVHV